MNPTRRSTNSAIPGPRPISQLEDFSKDNNLPSIKGLRQWLREANALRKQAEKAEEDCDYPAAYLLFSRSAEYILQKIPHHPSYTDLTAQQMSNLRKNGYDIEAKIKRLKPGLTDISSQSRSFYGAAINSSMESPSSPRDSHGRFSSSSLLDSLVLPPNPPNETSYLSDALPMGEVQSLPVPRSHSPNTPTGAQEYAERWKRQEKEKRPRSKNALIEEIEGSREGSETVQEVERRVHSERWMGHGRSQSLDDDRVGNSKSGSGSEGKEQLSKGNKIEGKVEASLGPSTTVNSEQIADVAPPLPNGFIQIYVSSEGKEESIVPEASGSLNGQNTQNLLLITSPKSAAEGEGETGPQRDMLLPPTIRHFASMTQSLSMDQAGPSNSRSLVASLENPFLLSQERESNSTSDILSLEQLMEIRTPADLTEEVVVEDSQKAAYGGFAVVYQGVWRNQIVAVKMLKPPRNAKKPASWEASMERRLMREMCVWAALSHPNIVDFLGYAKIFGEFPAMISTWCRQGTADDYFSNNQGLTSETRFRLVREVSDGIAYLHALKVIHGDLKPTNILIDEDSVARLCDFGLVRLEDWQGPAGMTTTSPYGGTERYKAPELFISSKNRHPMPTYEGDIYALGCVALEFVFSKPPFEKCRYPFEIYEAIKDREAPAARPKEAQGSVGFLQCYWDLLEGCWSWFPEHRPQIGNVVDALVYLSTLQMSV